MSQFKKSLTRFALSIPRGILPVLNLGSKVFVFRDADVREIQKRVAGFAWEALRYHPNAPALMRFAEKEHFIGGEERKKRRIKAGKDIFLMSLSAMFDPPPVDAPKTFNPDRPFSTYLYFGLGLHTCYGNHVNFVTIPEMLAAVLRRPHLKPIDKIEAEGPFANKWMWTTI